MKETEPVIHSDPDIMGGTPVFVGTRVPLATLLDYLEAGQPLSEFLADFPTVTRDQAVAALELVAPSNRIDDLRPLVPRVLEVLPTAKPGAVTVVGS
jgi:uncharacterized protein (DUF433 family)